MAGLLGYDKAKGSQPIVKPLPPDSCFGPSVPLSWHLLPNVSECVVLIINHLVVGQARVFLFLFATLLFLSYAHTLRLNFGIRSNAHSIFLVLQVVVYKQTVSTGISYYRCDILTRHSNRHFELKTFLCPIYNSLCFSRPTWQNTKINYSSDPSFWSNLWTAFHVLCRPSYPSNWGEKLQQPCIFIFLPFLWLAL